MLQNPLLIVVLISISCLCSSCSEDFLDIAPQGTLNEQALANKKGVDAALIAAYSMLDGWNNDWTELSPPWAASGSNWIWGSVVSDDAYKGAAPQDEPEISAIELLQWQANSPYLETKYKALYEGVSRANEALRLLHKAESVELEAAAKLEGEILFLRAHYHFEAYKIWGNIPYYFETDMGTKKTNATDPVPFILEDLAKAVAQLPVNQGRDKGRATQGAALAYRGKVLLYTGDFLGARQAFSSLIQQGNYALNPCFHDIFSSEKENADEMIFSIQVSVNDGSESGENGNYPDWMNFPGGSSPFRCCGFHQVSQNLVNAYEVDAKGLPLLYSFNQEDLSTSAFVDPRLDWTVGRDGVPYLGWGRHEASWIRSREYAGPFSPKKFVHQPGEESQTAWSTAQLGPVNIPIIRYADVLLMLAEAEVELNELERARELVNMIRMRASTCAQGPSGGSTHIDDSGITWATYKVGIYEDVWTDVAKARTAVRMERRLELALEGHRFFDLRRWGTAKEVLNAYNAVEATKRSYISGASAYEKRHDFYPLPSGQIELSKIDGTAQLIQNEGW